jgi:hypothetical protein
MPHATIGRCHQRYRATGHICYHGAANVNLLPLLPLSAALFRCYDFSDGQFRREFRFSDTEVIFIEGESVFSSLVAFIVESHWRGLPPATTAGSLIHLLS